MDTLDHYGLTSRQPATPESALPSSMGELAARLGHEGATLEPEQLAGLINRSDGAWRLTWDVYQVLRDFVLEPGYDPAQIAASHERAARFVEVLDADMLKAALASQTNIADRRKLLITLIEFASPAAVEKAARAAAQAYDKPYPKPLAGIVGKLRREATTLNERGRQLAAETLRSLVHEMVEMWSYGTFDTSATGVDHFFDDQLGAVAKDVKPEADRVVQLALEAGAVGPALWEAVQEIVLRDEVRQLINMLKMAPHDNRAFSMIASQFSNPQRLGTLLREPEIDFGSVDVLLKHMGTSATDTLLDELTTSTSRATRRGLLDRLARLGPSIGPAVTERLMKEERWFVVRNMLHVLREADCPVNNIALPGFQTHNDARVRREAMQLLFKDPFSRDRAIMTGVKDGDPYMIRAALKEARTGLPDVAVPVLAKRIMEQDFPPEFRVPAINMLGRSKSVLALEALLRFVLGGTTLLGKPKLAAKTPEMLAALRGLARTWPHERRAKPLLELAASAQDPAIVSALEITRSDSSKEMGDDVAE